MHNMVKTKIWTEKNNIVSKKYRLTHNIEFLKTGIFFEKK